MFYAQFILSKKGPLAKIWLAAHWDRKLSKAQIFETNVQDAVEEILKPRVKMALRTTGHLLLGIVRIYSRKAKYLLADCNEAFLKIKMAFRPGQVDLDEDAQQAAAAAINLPEVFHDFDAALPDFNDIDMQSQLHVSQSRIDDITLKEDLIPESNDMFFGADFGADDFGENSIAFLNDEGVEEARERASDVLANLDESYSHSTILEDSQGAAKQAAERSDHKLDIDLGDNIGMPDTVDDFGDFAADNMLDDVIFNEHELAKSIDAIEAPGAEHEMPMETEEIAGAVAGLVPSIAVPLVANVSFALEPLDAATVAVVGLEKAGRSKRKRRLIVDEQKNISGDEMKSNMADYGDTLQPIDLAPPTRKLMFLRETGTADKLFSNPGSVYLRAPALVQLYQSRLVLRAREMSSVTGDQVRRELEMLEIVDENIEPEGSIVSGFMDDRADDFDDMGAGAMSPGENIAPLEPVPEEDVPPAVPDEPQTSLGKDLLSGPERKKERRSRAERTLDEEDTAADGEDANRWTKRTQNVLNSISTKLKTSETGKITFSDLLTKGSTRKTAAQKFYTLLVLTKCEAIDVHQSAPFEEIEITAGPNISTTSVTC